MNPGTTTRPFASKISAPEAERSAPTFEIRLPSSSTSSGASVLDAGSRTRPFLIRSIRAFLCGMWCVHRSTGDEVIEQRHAHGESVGNLFEYCALRAVRDGGINFQAANHRTGMQNQRIGARKLQS